MFNLTVRHQRPRQNLHTALLALYPWPLPLLTGRTHSCCLSLLLWVLMYGLDSAIKSENIYLKTLTISYIVTSKSGQSKHRRSSSNFSAVAGYVVWSIDIIGFVMVQNSSWSVRLCTLSGISGRVRVDLPIVIASDVPITPICREERYILPW